MKDWKTIILLLLVGLFVIWISILTISGCAHRPEWIEVNEKSTCFKQEAGRTSYIPIEDRKKGKREP
jgi:hypothetical protein